MADPTLAAWDAVYQLLDAELSCAIYDFPPDGAARPFVLMNGMKSAVSDSRGTRRDTCTIELVARSAEQGQYELLTLIGQIDDALHDKRPGLSSGRTVSLRIAGKASEWEKDTESFLGRVSVTCVLEH